MPAEAAPPPEWVPDPEDERLHEPVGDTSLPWKDTWFFSVRDHDADVTLNTHITVSAGREVDTRVAVGVHHGAREALESLSAAGLEGDDVFGNELARFEAVNLSWDGDHELHWRAELAQVEFELTVRGVHLGNLWDTMFEGFFPSGKDGHRYSHVEQVVRAEGWLRWKGEEQVPVSAWGWRDRGWGRRQVTKTFTSDFDVGAGILPDGTAFSFTAMRNREHGPDAKLPVACWASGPGSLLQANRALLHRDSYGWPMRMEIDLPDGRSYAGTRAEKGSMLPVSVSDADPEGAGIGYVVNDRHAIFEDPDGARFGFYNQSGHIQRVDVFRDARFLHAPPTQG